MITKEQFLQALETVDAYHRQLLQESKQDPLTPIAEWYKFENCSRRLRNILYDIEQGVNYATSYKEDFIEKIQISEMRKMRGCGYNTLNEFKRLRGY